MKYTVVRQTTKELRSIGKDFINTYHSYIQFSDRPSRKLYWNLYEDDILVGVFGLGSGFTRPKVISNYMQEKNIIFNEVANNIVFCLANQKNKNAGTILLSLVRKDAIKWWKERYSDDLKCFQTFILPPRTGAIYKADNWEILGETTGKSLSSLTIRKAEYEKNKEYYDSKNIQRKVFASGEIRYILREFNESEKKIIFVKLVSRKERKRILSV